VSFGWRVGPALPRHVGTTALSKPEGNGRISFSERRASIGFGKTSWIVQSPVARIGRLHDDGSKPTSKDEESSVLRDDRSLSGGRNHRRIDARADVFTVDETEEKEKT